jgi:hypothetical protein
MWEGPTAPVFPKNKLLRFNGIPLFRLPLIPGNFEPKFECDPAATAAVCQHSEPKPLFLHEMSKIKIRHHCVFIYRFENIKGQYKDKFTVSTQRKQSTVFIYILYPFLQRIKLAE